MKNIGSIVSIHYALLSDILSITDPDSNESVDVSFPPGKSFTEFNFTPETALFTEDQQDNDAGPVYKQSLTFKVPKTSANIHSLMKGLLDREFILALTDGNGQNIIMGAITTPARMGVRILRPQSASGYNGYEFSFRCNCVDPAPFLNESFVIS